MLQLRVIGSGTYWFMLSGRDAEMLQGCMQAHGGLVQGCNNNRNLCLAVSTASEDVLIVPAGKLLL